MEWYAHQKRDLPWRKTKNPYKVWLSEIILQQTRVVQGLPYYERFVENFPTVEDLANASQEQVLKLWQGLGYYSRARNLHTSAKKVTNDFGGKFPTNFKGLLELKGIGEYTASAIASICYNEPVAVVDGNVYRVLARYFAIDTPINSTEGIKQFKKLAYKVLDKNQPGAYNQAIMDFGAIQCKPQAPYCTICPVQISCRGFSLGKVNDLPVKLKKTKVKKLYFNYLVMIDNLGNTILEKRTGKGIWQGLYEFPLLQTSRKANTKEIKEYTKQKFSTLQEISRYNDKMIVHKLSHRHLYVTFWIVKVEKLPKNSLPIGEIHNYPVSALIAKFLEGFEF